MSLAEILERVASAITGGIAGEKIEYRSSPSPVFFEINARVRRNPVDAVEGVLVKTIWVFISKADLAQVKPRQDEIRLASTEVGEEPKTYRVHRIIGPAPGHWYLEAIQ